MMVSPDLIEPRSRRLGRWIGAGVLICGLHVGGGSFAMLYWQEQLVEEAPGAIVVEIAPVATAVAEEPLDRPPGHVSEEAAATHASSDPKVEKVEEDTPKQDLRSPAVEPEVELPKPAKNEDQPDEKPKQDPSQQVKAADTETAASKATAPQRVTGEISTKAAAPDMGTSKADKRSIVSWQNSVVLHINRHKHYPASARLNDMQGDVHVHFSMDRSGQLAEARVVRSSGFSLLDEEAMAMLKRASPLPRPPLAVRGEMLELVVPIKFRIK